MPSMLVVDANVLFSFFKYNSERRKLIELLFMSDVKLFTPSFAFRELLSDKQRIMKFSRINEVTFAYLFSLLEKVIEQFSKSSWEHLLNDASKLSPHEKDNPYFALALLLNSSIWSDEKAFKEQSNVVVYSTSDLFRVF